MDRISESTLLYIYHSILVGNLQQKGAKESTKYSTKTAN